MFYNKFINHDLIKNSTLSYWNVFYILFIIYNLTFVIIGDILYFIYSNGILYQKMLFLMFFMIEINILCFIVLLFINTQILLFIAFLTKQCGYYYYDDNYKKLIL